MSDYEKYSFETVLAEHKARLIKLDVNLGKEEKHFPKYAQKIKVTAGHGAGGSYITFDTPISPIPLNDETSDQWNNTEAEGIFFAPWVNENGKDWNPLFCLPSFIPKEISEDETNDIRRMFFDAYRRSNPRPVSLRDHINLIPEHGEGSDNNLRYDLNELRIQIEDFESNHLDENDLWKSHRDLQELISSALELGRDYESYVMKESGATDLLRHGISMTSPPESKFPKGNKVRSLGEYYSVQESVRRLRKHFNPQKGVTLTDDPRKVFRKVIIPELEKENVIRLRVSDDRVALCEKENDATRNLLSRKPTYGRKLKSFMDTVMSHYKKNGGYEHDTAD